LPGGEHARGTKRLGDAHADVRVVTDAIAHRLVEHARLLARARICAHGGFGEALHGGMIAVDVLAWIGVEAADGIRENVCHGRQLNS